MKKEKMNLSCPKCYSNNIAIHKKEKEVSNNPVQISPITYECECQECHHKYELHYGYEAQINCIKPVPIDGYDNVKLLSSYKSDSPLDQNYKIVSINNDKDESFLLFIEDEQYPLLLSKDNIKEMKEEPPKVLTLLKHNNE